MKTKIITMLLAGLSLSAVAQNVQFHYDLGHNLYGELSGRPSVTTTVEMFKADKWGSTYMFTDLNYQRDGVAGAYWEISREFNVSGNKQWAAHVEYDGGLSSDETTWNATRFQHAALLGGAWNWHNGNFSKTFSVQLLYKQFFKSRHMGAKAFSSVQLTEVWGVNLANSLLSLNGFCDLWYDPNVNGKFILLSEPQLWVNLNAVKGCEGVNLSVGSEVKISNNFVWNDLGKNNRFYVIPTFAAKWTF